MFVDPEFTTGPVQADEENNSIDRRSSLLFFGPEVHVETRTFSTVFLDFLGQSGFSLAYWPISSPLADDVIDNQ